MIGVDYSIYFLTSQSNIVCFINRQQQTVSHFSKLAVLYITGCCVRISDLEGMMISVNKCSCWMYGVRGRGCGSIHIRPVIV